MSRPGIDTVYQENRALEAEIERLRERIKNLGTDLDRKIVTITRQRQRIEELESENVQLKQGYTAVRNDMSRVSRAAKERIEELEDASVKEVLDFGVEQLSRGHDKYHIITTEQIRAAWDKAGTLSGEYYEDVPYETLAELGIVRCEGREGREGCGGCGQVQVYTKDDDYDADGCPDCNGEGFLIGEKK